MQNFERNNIIKFKIVIKFLYFLIKCIWDLTSCYTSTGIKSSYYMDKL